MLERVRLDITTVTHGVVAHGCNTRGKMGAGIARVISDKWPTIVEPYQRLCDAYGSDLLGLSHQINVSDVESPVGGHLYVSNCFTQVTYGRMGRHADVEAIRLSLESTLIFARAMRLPVFMPEIGCGLGGLSWEHDVEPVARELAVAYPEVEIFVCTFDG